MSIPKRPRHDNVATLQQVSGSSSRPPEERYLPGDVIADKYRLTSLIGEGGMGAVWLARNLTLHVDVALKLIRRDISSAQTADRLLQEARAAARLQHPSIVRVHDFGESDQGDPFIVMELLNGESFGAVLDRKGSLPAPRAVQMLLPIISALSDAHSLGIVHRDLKPENIILVAERSGTIVPKLVDFGIAKMKRGAVVTGEFPADPDSTAARNLARKLTQLGSLVGSPDYMSPEQARGDADLDERADLWSICVVLYEAIAGRRPFEGTTVEDLLLAVLLKDPQPATLFGGGDPALWSILERGLTRNRNERWQSARDMGKALAGWLLDKGVDTDITGTSLKQHWLEEGGRSALSEFPGADGHLVERDPLGVNETPARLDRVIPLSERPPRRKAPVWLTAVVAAAVAVVALAVVIALRVAGGDAQAEVAAAATSEASVVATSEPAPTPVPAATAAPATSATAEPVASAEPPASAAPTTPTGKAAPPVTARPTGPPKKPSSSGGMPIPDVPNF